MYWIQLISGIALVIFGGIFIAYNAFIFWVTVVQKAHAPSVAPIVGGIIATAGLLILPVSSSWHWAWLPLVVDWGGIPIFLYHWLIEKNNL